MLDDVRLTGPVHDTVGQMQSGLQCLTLHEFVAGTQALHSLHRHTLSS